MTSSTEGNAQVTSEAASNGVLALEASNTAAAALGDPQGGVRPDEALDGRPGSTSAQERTSGENGP